MTSFFPPLPPKNQTPLTHNNPPPLPPKGRQSSSVSSSQNNSATITQPLTLRTTVTTAITNTTTSTKSTFSTISTPSINQTQLLTTQKPSAPPLPPKKTAQVSSSEGNLSKIQPEKLPISSSQSTGNLNPRSLSKDSTSILNAFSKEEKLVMRARFNTTKEPRPNLPSATDALQTIQPPKVNPRPLPPSPSKDFPTFAAPTSIPVPQPSKPQTESPEPVPMKSFKTFSESNVTASTDFFCPDFTTSNPDFSIRCYASVTPPVDFSNFPSDSNITRNRSMSVDSAAVPVGSVRDKTNISPNFGNNLGYLGNSTYNTKYKGKEGKKPDRESLSGASFKCDVVSAQTIVDNRKRKDKFTVYTVLVCFTVPTTCKNPGEYSWQIFRRYKQFFELNCKMGEFGITTSKNNQLPPKTNKDKFHEDFIEYRRQRLEAYLEELATFGWKIFADPRSTFHLLKFMAPVQFNDEKPPGFVLPFKVEPC